MKTKLIKRINYFEPGGSFKNSYLGQLVTANLEKVKTATNEFGNRVVSNVRKAKKTVDDRDKRRKWAELRARKRSGILNDIARIQDELFKGGFYGDGVTYELAVDGIWGKRTLLAYDRRKYDKKPDKSISAKIGRAVANPVVKTLNNMFPFGYDDSRVSSHASEKINNELDKIGIHDTNLGNKAGQAIGFIAKLLKGITNTDRAGQAMKEFADLDLSKPENLKRAQELWDIANEEEPRWGHLTGSMQRRLQAVRARIDLNLMHGGLPQKYNTFTKATGYDTRSGERTYGYNDPEMQRNEEQYVINYIRTHKPTSRTANGSYIWTISGGDPYAAHGDHSIIADDLKGTNVRDFDVWDFGHGDIISSKNLPGMKQILVGVKGR